MSDELARILADGTIELWDIAEVDPPVRWAGVDALAAAYTAKQRDDGQDDRTLGAATEFLMRLAGEAPPWSVDLMRELVVRLEAPEVVALGCGPLEDLVRHESHDLRRIAEIEAAALELPGFQKALSNVWMSEDLPRDIRDRMSRLGARDFVAGKAMDESQRAAYVEYREARGWDWG